MANPVVLGEENPVQSSDGGRSLTSRSLSGARRARKEPLMGVTLFQAELNTPGRLWPASHARREAAERGEQVFSAIQCAKCHVPAMVLNNPVFTERNPYNPNSPDKNLQIRRPAHRRRRPCLRGGRRRRRPRRQPRLAALPTRTWQRSGCERRRGGARGASPPGGRVSATSCRRPRRAFERRGTTCGCLPFPRPELLGSRSPRTPSTP